MSDKEENLPGRRDPKAVNRRMKKKNPATEGPRISESKEAALKAPAQNGNLSSLSGNDLTLPEGASGASVPQGESADPANPDPGKDPSSATPEENGPLKAMPQEESTPLKKPSAATTNAASGEKAAEELDRDEDKAPGAEASEGALLAKTRDVEEEIAVTEKPASEGAGAQPTQRAEGGGGEASSAASADPGYGKLRLGLWILAIGLIIVAVGNVYYARTLADREQEARQTLAEKLTEQLAVQVDNQVEAKLEEQRTASEKPLREAMAQLARENQRQAEEFQEFQQKIATLESTLGVLRTEAQKSPEAEDWDIAEVAYLLRIANERLQLERDVKTTLVALQAADQILRKVADPALTPVRSQLAEEINALKSLPMPDIGGMSLSLASLIEQVRSLELKESVVEETTASDETEGRSADRAAEEDQEDVAAKARRFLGLVWDDLKHLVMVRRRGKGDEGLPVLPPEERYFLYRNLELELEAARLSLLRKDEEGFRQSLHLAQNWLQTYFQGAEAEVMRETLAELAQIDIRPPLPSISGSLKTLNRAWSRARAQTSGGS